MFNVGIGNLGKYNEGELVGEWLNIPVSKKKIKYFESSRRLENLKNKKSF